MSETRTIIGIFRLRLVDLMVHAIYIKCMKQKKKIIYKNFKTWRFMIMFKYACVWGIYLRKVVQ